jgi:hypothetical protein
MGEVLFRGEIKREEQYSAIKENCGNCYHDSFTMKLKMFIDHKLIDETPVDFKLITAPRYLDEKRSVLEEKHKLLILRAISRPVCYVDNVPSKVNGIIAEI